MAHSLSFRVNVCTLFVPRKIDDRWCDQCTGSDLEYYVRECGEIMGVTKELSEETPASNGPMGILDHVFKRLIRFKMLNQEVLLALHILV